MTIGCCPTCQQPWPMALAVSKKAHDLSERLREIGICEGVDGLLSEKQVLAAFPHWSEHQLRRWRENLKLPAATSPSRSPRYSIESIARALVDGEIDEKF